MIIGFGYTAEVLCTDSAPRVVDAGQAQHIP